MSGDGSPVEQIDHIMSFAYDHPALVRLLTDTLRLPLTWPEPGSAWTQSSGISFGNVDLEVMPHTRRTGLGNLALEARDWPTLPDVLARRGAATLDPGTGPIDPRRPQDGPRWTTLMVRGTGMFFVRYHHFDMAERRRSTSGELARRGGGPLGVVRMTEVFRGSEDLDAQTAVLSRLLGPPEAGTHTWRLGAGPRFTLVPPDDPRNGRMTVQVHSLDAAVRALDSLAIGHTRVGAEVHMDSERVHGLALVLRQR